MNRLQFRRMKGYSDGFRHSVVGPVGNPSPHARHSQEICGDGVGKVVAHGIEHKPLADEAAPLVPGDLPSGWTRRESVWGGGHYFLEHTSGMAIGYSGKDRVPALNDCVWAGRDGRYVLTAAEAMAQAVGA